MVAGELKEEAIINEDLARMVHAEALPVVIVAARETLEAESANPLENEAKFKAFKLDQAREEIKPSDVVDSIGQRVKVFEDAGERFKHEKTTLRRIRDHTTQWVEKADPNNERARTVYESLEDPARTLIVDAYAEEVRMTLQVVDKYLGEQEPATPATRAIIERLVAAKTEEEIAPEEKEKRDAHFRTTVSRNLDADQLTQLEDILHTIQEMGPLPFDEFVTTQIGEATSAEQVDEKIREIEVQRSQAYEKLVRIIDRTTIEKTARPRWEHNFDAQAETWDKLSKAVKPENIIDTTSAEHFIERKGFWGKEARKQTPQTIISTRAQAIREITQPTGEVIRREVDVQQVHITLRTEQKMFNDTGVARTWNPWQQRDVHTASYNTLEQCTEGLIQLSAAEAIDANTDQLLPKPFTRTEDGKVVDAEGHEITRPIKYGVTIVQNGEPKRVVVNAQTYNAWRNQLLSAKATWESHGFTYDPSKHTRKNLVESPCDKVDMIRQRIAMEDVYQDMLRGIQERNSKGANIEPWTDADRESFEDAMEMYRVFSERYGNTEAYKRMAMDRVRSRGIEENTATWHSQLVQETNNIVIEMSLMEGVLRDFSTKAVENRMHPELLSKALRNLDEKVVAELAGRLVRSSEGTIDPVMARDRVRELVRSYLTIKVDSREPLLPAAEKTSTVMKEFETFMEASENTGVGVDMENMMPARRDALHQLELVLRTIPDDKKVEAANSALAAMGETPLTTAEAMMFKKIEVKLDMADENTRKSDMVSQDRLRIIYDIQNKYANRTDRKSREEAVNEMLAALKTQREPTLASAELLKFLEDGAIVGVKETEQQEKVILAQPDPVEKQNEPDTPILGEQLDGKPETGVPAKEDGVVQTVTLEELAHLEERASENKKGTEKEDSDADEGQGDTKKKQRKKSGPRRQDRGSDNDFQIRSSRVRPEDFED